MMLPAGTDRQHRGCIIPQAVTQSSAPEDGRNHRPKPVELIGIINKPLLLHLVGVYIIYTIEVFGIIHRKKPQNRRSLYDKNKRYQEISVW